MSEQSPTEASTPGEGRPGDGGSAGPVPGDADTVIVDVGAPAAEPYRAGWQPTAPPAADPYGRYGAAADDPLARRTDPYAPQADPNAAYAAPADPYAAYAAPADPYAGYRPAAGSAGAYGYPGQVPVVPDRPERRLGLGVVVAVAAVTALVAGLLAGIGGYALARSSDRATGSTAGPVVLPQAQGDTSPRASDTIAGIVEAVLPAVVSIQVRGGGGGGTGSGFVVRENGYVITNNHVISAAVDGGSVEVFFGDGSSADGEIVGRNVSSDLAVVKVDRTGLPTVQLGDSDTAQVGDTAIAIGAPLGLEGTVTSGIVSALDRPVTAGGQGDQSFISAIQTDAAINPGNSGGPLLDGSGRVIGVNSAIATLATGGEGGSIGLGFAIPINNAKRIAEEIIETGSSSTPIIGVELDLTYTGPGARLSTVNPGGPADDAGLRSGDVILAVDGRPVADADELVVAIRTNAPGDTLTLTVERGGDETEVDVVLAADTDRTG